MKQISTRLVLLLFCIRQFTLDGAGFLNRQLVGLAIDDDAPFDVYHAVSSSEIKSLTSLSKSSFTVPGRMTEDQGRDGLETGDSQLAT
jgi:hypothetical protein